MRVVPVSVSSEISKIMVVMQGQVSKRIFRPQSGQYERKTSTKERFHKMNMREPWGMSVEEQVKEAVHVPSHWFLEAHITVFSLCVKRIRSTPYFLLMIVLDILNQEGILLLPIKVRHLNVVTYLPVLVLYT